MKPTGGALALVVVLALVGVAYSTTVSNELGSLGGDSAHYVMLGDALAAGHGYVEAEQPGQPRHTLYPPLLPALLAVARTVEPMGYRLGHWLIVASALATAAGLFLLVREWAGAPIAVATAVLFTSLPVVVRALVPILSELPFAALVVGSLVCWQRHERTNDVAPLAGAIVLAALAFLMRSAGLALILVLLVGLAWRAIARHELRKRNLVMALVLIAPVVGWQLWTATGTGERASYFKQLSYKDPYQPALGTVDAGDLVERATNRVVFYGKVVRESFGEGLADRAAELAPIAGWIAAALAALGLLGAIARPRLWLGFGLVYVAMIAVWPWSGPRFLLPVLPFVCALVAGGAALVQQASRVVLSPRFSPFVGPAVVALLIVAALPGWERFHRVRSADLTVHARGGVQLSIAFSEYHDAHVWCRHGVERARVAANAWGDYLAAGVWLRRHDPNARVSCRKPRLTALFGRVSAVGLPSPNVPDATWQRLEASGVGYVISLRRAFTPDAAQRAIDAARDAYPGRFTPVWSSPNAEVLALTQTTAASSDAAVD